ncbi:hypothetical protein FQN49_001115 [Arthroderma sp. PD_2]|nr:hypothetical protein FQN49_001115 [Arthroderma sp. PD_2]
MEESIAEEPTRGGSRKDIMHYLLKAKNPATGQGLSEADLKAESNLFITAGLDTTSTTLSSTIFYLLNNSEAMHKVKDEVRATFSAPEQVQSGPKLSILVYTRACTDEALRLNPPSLSPMPRQRWIVARTSTGEVDEDDAQRVADARAAFFAFSAGFRVCLGRDFAYTELLTALTTLVLVFDIRLPPDPSQQKPSGRGSPSHVHWGRIRQKEYQTQDYLLVDRGGPMAQLKRR